MNRNQHTESETQERGIGKFRGWRLLGVLALVIGFIALMSALVDWLFHSGILQL